MDLISKRADLHKKWAKHSLTLGTFRSYPLLFKSGTSGHDGMFSAGRILATYPGLCVLDQANRAVFRRYSFQKGATIRQLCAAGYRPNPVGFLVALSLKNAHPPQDVASSQFLPSGYIFRCYLPVVIESAAAVTALSTDKILHPGFNANPLLAGCGIHSLIGPCVKNPGADGC